MDISQNRIFELRHTQEIFDATSALSHYGAGSLLVEITDPCHVHSLTGYQTNMSTDFLDPFLQGEGRTACPSPLPLTRSTTVTHAVPTACDFTTICSGRYTEQQRFGVHR